MIKKYSYAFYIVMSAWVVYAMFVIDGWLSIFLALIAVFMMGMIIYLDSVMEQIPRDMEGYEVLTKEKLEEYRRASLRVTHKIDQLEGYIHDHKEKIDEEEKYPQEGDDHQV